MASQPSDNSDPHHNQVPNTTGDDIEATVLESIWHNPTKDDLATTEFQHNVSEWKILVDKIKPLLNPVGVPASQWISK